MHGKTIYVVPYNTLDNFSISLPIDSREVHYLAENDFSLRKYIYIIRLTIVTLSTEITIENKSISVKDDDDCFRERKVHEAARLSHGFDKSLTEQFPSEPMGSDVGSSLRKYFRV